MKSRINKVWKIEKGEKKRVKRKEFTSVQNNKQVSVKPGQMEGRGRMGWVHLTPEEEKEEEEEVELEEEDEDEEEEEYKDHPRVLVKNIPSSDFKKSS